MSRALKYNRTGLGRYNRGFLPEGFPMDFQRVVTTWAEFKQRWGGLHNFLLGGEITAGFAYEMPPIERIVEEVRADQHGLVRSGVKKAEFDLTDIKAAFCELPVAEALRSRFVLAHFSLHPHLTGKGRVFEGLEEQWVEPWRRTLTGQGFTFENVFVILFASGPDSASNYHMDATHQLAWQRIGTKQFHGLKDPDRWTTPEQRGRCSLVGMKKPHGVREADAYTIDQPPGTVLWNAVTTPHWVETHDQPAATLTLVHTGLRLNGKLCPHAEEREAWQRANATPETAATRY
jgi:hypothetical protein